MKGRFPVPVQSEKSGNFLAVLISPGVKVMTSLYLRSEPGRLSTKPGWYHGKVLSSLIADD